MNLSEFLKAVVPDGNVVVGWKDDKFHNKFAQSQQQALQFIRKKAREQVDIYYALASFKQGWHTNGKGKKVLRVRSNVDQLKALWFDIDFKGGLSDPTQVVAALREFSKRTGMPAPSILVHSGNGVHAYWPLETPVPYERWQRMADNLKELAHEHKLPADTACTADACRVLRPPGTRNWKQSDNPKPVVPIFTSGKSYDPEDIEVALESARGHYDSCDDLGNTPSYLMHESIGSGAEFTGGHAATGEPVTSLFSNISKRCGAARLWLDTRGQDCSEPEWTASLQLLKYCVDRDLYVHELSKGHIGYSPQETDEKFQQRLDNDAGPTLCKTIEGYRPDICAACPHYEKIKTPLVLGVEATFSAPAGVLLSTWRAVPNGNGMERKMLNPETNTYQWDKRLRRTYDDIATSRSINTGMYELRFKVLQKGARDIEIFLPTTHLGNDNKLRELMAGFGAPLMPHELKDFKDLMTTWLDKLQAARAETDATEQLGWVRNENLEIEGFSAGTTTYLNDGTQKRGVRIRSEFAAIGRMYEPSGSLDKWKEVAGFLTLQDNPAFTAVLSSAFAAPLITFTGIPGGILSIVSPESGVGKSSAMKCAQAVWGSPTHGINSVDDTKLSVARKLGFLNNLPAYWDELRGKETMEGFITLAFQVAQGKEKTRLDSSATMREVNTWETLLVAASNESIFDYMGNVSQGSDAGVARTYEISVDPFETDKSRAEVAMLFETLNQNYGKAGQIYAEYIANNHNAIREDVSRTFMYISNHANMRPVERIWFAIVTVLIVGAKTANAAELTSINTRSLASYLMSNIRNLRRRSHASMLGSTPAELIAAYMQQHQDKGLIVEELHPGRGVRDHDPHIISPPRADKIVYQLAKKQGIVRVSKGDFTTWLKRSKEINWSTVEKRFRQDLSMEQSKTMLGIGTKWQMPRQFCLDMHIDYAEELLDE